MTAKTITTTYAGYSLAAGFDSLTITATGAIDGVAGGAGVGGYNALTVDHTASVQNAGSVVGGGGGTGVAYGAGGVGGVGADFTGAVTMTNTGVVLGGQGGAGPPAGGLGGAGGAGVVLEDGGAVVNGGTIAGGSGGLGKLGHAQSGDGIFLGFGGSVNNTGAISGQYAIYVAFGSQAVSVTNSGALSGVGVGVEEISAGASIDNEAGGSIYGGLGAVLLNSIGTVDNYGTMTAPSGPAVLLSGGGGLTNGSAADTKARISGYGGVEAFGSATITNFGTIDGGAADGVDLIGGGSVVNKAGKITGARVGVSIETTTATVTNYGTLQGTQAAVEFYVTSASNRLILAAGSHLIGGVYGGGGTLELASGKGATSYLGSPTSDGFHGFANYQVDAGGTWTLSGINTITYGDTLTNEGRIILAQKTGFAGLFFSDGQTLLGGGTVSLSASGYIGGAGGLTNLDNTIVGGGIIKSVTLTNDGTIDNNLGRMVINTGNTVTNAGLIECMATGQLLIRNTTIDSSGGGSVIDAHRVQIDNATLLGGSLTINKGETLITILHASTIDLPGGTVTNAGFIDGAAGGGLTIMGDVASSGFVQAYKGNLTIKGAVTGAGQARVFGAGVLEIDGSLSENLVFAAGSTGKAVLGGAFTGFVFGLSHTGANSIDLKGVIANGYSYKGTVSSGTLTLTEGGTKVTTVKLSGDYLTSTFVLSSDGGTGTILKDPQASAPLAQAMASFGDRGAASATAAIATSTTPAALSRPH